MQLKPRLSFALPYRAFNKVQWCEMYLVSAAFCSLPLRMDAAATLFFFFLFYFKARVSHSKAGSPKNFPQTPGKITWVNFASPSRGKNLERKRLESKSGVESQVRRALSALKLIPDKSRVFLTLGVLPTTSCCTLLLPFFSLLHLPDAVFFFYICSGVR